MDIERYIHLLTNRIFKILPIYEEDHYFSEYVNSLYIDLSQAPIHIPSLSHSNSFLSILDILKYMQTNYIDHKQCKREIFKITNELLPKVIIEIGEHHD